MGCGRGQKATIEFQADCAKLRRDHKRYFNNTNDSQENVGSFTKSCFGTDSKGCPALSQAVSPPVMTNVLNPLSRSKCATRALVASRAQLQ